jgi:hypothetical protein
MPRQCVFCGGRPTTREHVWPAWARPHIAEAEADTQPHHRWVIQDEHPDVHHKWDQPANSMTANAVCAACNNGWMSRLEQAAQPILESMLGGRGRVLHQSGQRTLAAWALKTAMMIDRTNAAVRRVIATQEYQHLHQVGEPSGQIKIWLASYHGDALTMGRTWGLDANRDVADPDRGQRDMWGATVVFGAGVFQLFGTRLAPLLAEAQANAPNVHTLWPYQAPFVWAQRPAFDDRTLGVFAEGLLHQILSLSGG